MDVDATVTTTIRASNEIVPPSQRIPPEIVVRIIQELLPTDIGYGPLTRKRLNVLLNASSICRYWRYAAFDHANFWSIVPIDRRSLGALFLQRSRNAPLLITYEVNTRRCCPAHQAMVLLLPHMQRVRKVQLRASAPVLNQIFSRLNVYTSSAQLEEIRIQVHGSPDGEKSRVALDLLLENASTLKVLQLDDFKCHFPVRRLREFSHLTHLELLSPHDFREISPLMISLPILISIKVCVSASEGRGDNIRIVPQVNLRHVHLLFDNGAPSLVLGALGIPTGIHLECEMPICVSTIEAARFLPLESEAFQNASQIEELQFSASLHGSISFVSYTGSGPSGSFRIGGYFQGGYRPPIQDFSNLLKLVADAQIALWHLENAVASAPRLVSVTFVHCTVTTSLMLNRVLGTPLNPVDADSFVKAISEERRADARRSLRSIMVNGVLEGELLEEFRSLSWNHDQV